MDLILADIYKAIVRIVADGLLIPVAIIGLYAVIREIPAKGRYQSYVRIVMAGLTGLLIAKLMSLLYTGEAARPFQLAGQAAGALYLDNHGFPSDHALFAGAITLAVFAETKARRLGYILIVLTVLICVGRIVSLVHTPIDILGGLFAAMMGGFWYLLPYARKSLSFHLTDK